MSKIVFIKKNNIYSVISCHPLAFRTSSIVLLRKHLNRIGLSFTLRFCGFENGIIAAELFVNELTVLLNTAIWAGLLLVLLVKLLTPAIALFVVVELFDDKLNPPPVIVVFTLVVANELPPFYIIKYSLT